MSTLREAIAILPARILLSFIFLFSGVGKITGWTMTLGFMSQKGMPAPGLLLAGAIVVELLGGLSVLLGYRARIGALLLFLYLIPTTLIFHNFWAAPPEMHQMQLANFMKNAAIMGGLLFGVAHGSGPLSLDARKKAV